MLNPKPGVVVIEVTRKCQNDCFHCFVYTYDEQVLGIFDRKSEMKKKDFFKIIDDLAEHVDGKLMVQPMGGEPTLHKDIFELAEYPREYGFDVTTTTNAIKLADKDFAEKFAEHFSSVVVTLHSHIPEIHNSIVRNRAFARTLKGLKNLLKEGVGVSVNSALTKLNAPKYTETVEFLAELGVESINVNLSIPVTKKVEEYGWYLKLREYADYIIKILKKAEEVGININTTHSWKLCIFNPIPFGIGHYPCSIGSCIMEIDTWGNIVACYVHRERIGNVLKDGVEKVWHSEKMNYYRKREYLKEYSPKCLSCGSLESCGGPCLSGFCQVKDDIKPLSKRHHYSVQCPI